jgi:translation initiation factor IF-2
MTSDKKANSNTTLSLSSSTLGLKNDGDAAQKAARGGSFNPSKKSVSIEIKKKRTIDRPGSSAKGGSVGNRREDAQRLDMERDARAKALLSSRASEGAENAKINVQALLKNAQAEEKSKQAAEQEEREQMLAEREEKKRLSQEAARVPAKPLKTVDKTSLRQDEMKERDEINEQLKEQQQRRPASPTTQSNTADSSAVRTKSFGEQQAVSTREHTPSPFKKGVDHKRFIEDEEETEKSKALKALARRAEEKRQTHKLNVSKVLSGYSEDEEGRFGSGNRRFKKKKMKHEEIEKVKIIRDVILPEFITVQDLANRMAERSADVIKSLMKLGIMVTINQVIDADTAELVASEFGHKIQRVADSDVEIGIRESTDESSDKMIPRPPVVTIMGHVDHGKTSLLDALRSTDVAAKEAGGITQHIGAYQIQLKDKSRITFIDTPGHAAFTEMRARGANVTDIVVLVVAADDSIMPQTIEAINHAKAANVPIIIAINKCDLPTANPNKVKQDLLQHEIVVEDMGGEYLTVEVSAKSKMGLDKLEEIILLQAEIQDLRANPNQKAQGVVVESKLEQGRGSVATILVQKGTLCVGDIFIAGSEWGRVRALINDRGQQIKEAMPSLPVEIFGLTGTPSAGDDFIVVENETKAKEIAAYRQRKIKLSQEQVYSKSRLEEMFNKIKSDEMKELPVILKSDVHGSLEAIAFALTKITGEEHMVRVKIIHTSVGAITEADMTLAKASNAIVIGFNVRANPQARELAKKDHIEIKYYSIIYDIIDDMKGMLSGMLAPKRKETFTGYAEIRQVFNITKIGKVGGCMVTNGIIRRGAGVRLLRDDVVIHEGKLKTLKRFKDEVKEAREGFECGMAFENYEDIKVGDVIEAFEVEHIQQSL